MAMGKHIKTHREARGWTLADLSERSGVELGTIGALEVRDSARSKFASAIAKAFGLTVEELEAAPPDSSVEQITIPEARPPPAPYYPQIQSLEQRTVTRPPMTDDEWIVVDGFRIASEEVRNLILKECLLALRLHGQRSGDAQKKA